MDLSMPPGESGLIATSKIHESFPETKILILTMYDDEEYLFHVLRNGAKGYILKTHLMNNYCLLLEQFIMVRHMLI